jgi:hypothetical protein
MFPQMTGHISDIGYISTSQRFHRLYAARRRRRLQHSHADAEGDEFDEFGAAL